MVLNKGQQNSAFTSGQKTQWLRIIAGIRKVLSKSVNLSGSETQLATLADQTEALDKALEDCASGRVVEQYNWDFDRQKPNDAVPFNAATGAMNPMSPPMRVEVEGVQLSAYINFSNVYEGPPGGVHGGIVSLLWDQLLAQANLIYGTTGPTASLNVEYVKLSPIQQELRFVASVDSVVDKKIITKGVCYAGEEVISRAEGLFIKAWDLSEQV